MAKKLPPDGRGKRPRDPNELAKWITDALTDKEAHPKKPLAPKNEAAVALSKLGASKGGRARAAKLSDRRRKQIAKAAAKARWRSAK